MIVSSPDSLQYDSLCNQILDKILHLHLKITKQNNFSLQQILSSHKENSVLTSQTKRENNATGFISILAHAYMPENFIL